ETLDNILPEAFAAIREADKRVLGMFPYDVQVMGGIVLHQGNIAEMKTGEGKTLTATMPMYLNALRSEEHTSELQSRFDLVCRLLLEKKKNTNITFYIR